MITASFSEVSVICYECSEQFRTPSDGMVPIDRDMGGRDGKPYVFIPRRYIRDKNIRAGEWQMGYYEQREENTWYTDWGMMTRCPHCNTINFFSVDLYVSFTNREEHRD